MESEHPGWWLDGWTAEQVEELGRRLVAKQETDLSQHETEAILFYAKHLEARAEAAEKERDELRFWLTGWKELHALAMNEVLPRGKNRAYQETDK